MVILNDKIIRAIIKEELETAERYKMLADKYNIPILYDTARDELKHAYIFRQLLASRRFE